VVLNLFNKAIYGRKSEQELNTLRFGLRTITGKKKQFVSKKDNGITVPIF